MANKKVKSERKKTDADLVVDCFYNLFKEKYGVTPEIPRGWVDKMIWDLLKNHSVKGLQRVIELYFEKEEKTVYHLPSILSSWSINKYLPMARLDPRVYADAEEHNKDIW